MNSIFKITGSLCTMVYILGLLCNLTDITYTQKTIRLTIAVYIIVSVLIPMKNMDFDFKFSENINLADVNADIEEYVVLHAETNLRQSIINELDNKKISYSDVLVHINKQSNSVYVDSIEFYGISDNDKHLISQLFENEGKIIYGD